MALVVQKTMGFIYFDEFLNTSLDSRWEILPTNASSRFVTSTPGKLSIRHGNVPAYTFFSELTTTMQFVIDVKCTYNPTTDDDRAGIIVFAHYDDYITLEQFYDVATHTSQAHNFIRLIRDYNTYYAYYSDDGIVWNVIGSQDFDRLAPKIGLYIKGTNGSNFDVDYVKIYKTPKITINNLTPGIKVELFKDDDTLIETKICRSTDTEVKFDVFGYEYPIYGKFKITISRSSIV